jgi:hypothetical protein
VKNLVAQATWRPWFVHLCYKNILLRIVV